MNSLRGATHASEFLELIPWHLNGTLAAATRRRLEDHLLDCALCREALRQEERLLDALRAQPDIEYMPAVSFKRLQSRLDGKAAASVSVRASPRQIGLRRRTRIAALAIAASLAIVVIGLREIPVHRWLGSPPTLLDFHTVTSPAPATDDAVVRAVFSGDITVLELQTLLEQAHLRIIGGPTEAGVYSLAATSNRPVNESLALLRRHPSVRFAESVHQAVSH